MGQFLDNISSVAEKLVSRLVTVPKRESSLNAQLADVFAPIHKILYLRDDALDETHLEEIRGILDEEYVLVPPELLEEFHALKKLCAGEGLSREAVRETDFGRSMDSYYTLARSKLGYAKLKNKRRDKQLESNLGAPQSRVSFLAILGLAAGCIGLVAALFGMLQAEAPKIYPLSTNSSEGSREIMMTSEGPFSTIYYTLDGSDPKIGGMKYEGPFEITESTVIIARSRSLFFWSDLTTRSCVVSQQPVSAAEDDTINLSKDQWTYSSSDPGVIRIDDSGVLVAVGPGEAEIIVYSKDGVAVAQYAVTVPDMEQDAS